MLNFSYGWAIFEIVKTTKAQPINEGFYHRRTPHCCRCHRPIVTVAYTGISKSAQTASITSELKQWHKLFEAYKAVNGSYPAPAPSSPAMSGGPGTNALSTYCLGTGFPQSAGAGYCRAANSTATYRATETTGASLITQLTTVGTPPKNSAKYVYDTNVVGPHLVYNGVTDVRLYSIFPPASACPSGMILGYTNANRIDCYIRLDYS